MYLHVNRSDIQSDKDGLSGYKYFHYKSLTVLRPSYLYNGVAYAGKTTSLYLRRPIAPLLIKNVRRLTAESRKALKRRDWMLQWSFRSEIWQASRQRISMPRINLVAPQSPHSIPYAQWLLAHSVVFRNPIDFTVLFRHFWQSMS